MKNDFKIELIVKPNEEKFINNNLGRSKKNRIKHILSMIDLISMNDYKNNTSTQEKILEIVNSYIELFQLENKNSEKKIEDSFVLNKKIFMSRLDSNAYKHQNENLDSLLFDILSSLRDVTKGDKPNIKSISKLISYNDKVFDEKIDVNQINKSVESNIKSTINSSKEQCKNEYINKVNLENHKYSDNKYLENKENIKKERLSFDNYIRGIQKLKFIIKHNGINLKILNELIKRFTLKELMKYISIEKLKELGKDKLEKYFTNEELYEIYKDEKYKMSFKIIKTKYNDLYKNLEQKTNLTNEEILLLNNKNILDTFKIFEYVNRVEEKSMDKNNIIKIYDNKNGITINNSILIENSVNTIRKLLNIKKEYKMNQILKIEDTKVVIKSPEIKYLK